MSGYTEDYWRAYDAAVSDGKRLARKRTVLCDANAKRGTGTGVCNRPLDEHGQCDRAGDHL